MKIATNIRSLRNSGPYFNQIGIEFIYLNTNIYTLINYKPDVLMVNNCPEAMSASVDYPDIKFIGDGYEFPNYQFKFPDALLNELSVLQNNDITFPECDISYVTSSGKDNELFIYKLKALGNLKIAGPSSCIDTVHTYKNSNMSPLIYKHSKYCAADNEEEILKILFMNKPCITNIRYPNTYFIDNVKLNEILPTKTQVHFAWQASHTSVLGSCLGVLMYNDYQSKLKELLKFEGKNETGN